MYEDDEGIGCLVCPGDADAEEWRMPGTFICLTCGTKWRVVQTITDTSTSKV